MLDYVHQRAREILGDVWSAVLATSGPAGVRAGEFTCEVFDLQLFLLLPQTSDHLYNIKHDPRVTLLTPDWEMQGLAEIVPKGSSGINIALLLSPSAKWYDVVKVEPHLLHVKKKNGWGYVETIDLMPD